MYEIKNTGKKLVHIGKKTIFPGESLTVSDKSAKTAGVKALEKAGLLIVTEKAEKKAAPAKATKKPEPVVEEVEEEVIEEEPDESEIAVENMSLAQLKSVAAQMGINTEGLRTKASYIEAIEAMAED